MKSQRKAKKIGKDKKQQANRKKKLNQHFMTYDY